MSTNHNIIREILGQMASRVLETRRAEQRIQQKLARAAKEVAMLKEELELLRKAKRKTEGELCQALRAYQENCTDFDTEIVEQLSRILEGADDE